VLHSLVSLLVSFAIRFAFQIYDIDSDGVSVALVYVAYS